MNLVSTPDGYGEVLRSESVRGKTSYLVKGAGFEGWYDRLQVTADFAQSPDDVVPNMDNYAVLPYTSRPQGPGKDGTTSTIEPGIDPHIEWGQPSNSLTGEPTDEDPVKADIEHDFKPHSHLSGVRPRRVHFAGMDDPVLDVSSIPGSSPTGLQNSPINPDGVDTNDLFDGSLPHFERESAVYEKLVIKDDLSFLRLAADEDNDDDDGDKKKDDDSDDKSDDDNDDDGDSDSSDNDKDGKYTAALVLSTTSDLHFLANLCVCAEALPLHSKSEHRELKAEADFSTPSARGPANGVTPQEQDLEKLEERYTDPEAQGQWFHQPPSFMKQVDRSQDAGDSAANYNHYASVQHRADGYDKYIGSNGDGTYHLIASGGGKLAKGKQYGHYDSYQDAHDAVQAVIERNHSHGSVKTAAPAQPPQPTQIESQIEQLMQFWAVDSNGWWHWTGSQADLALLNQMQQQMTAVGMPGGPPGQQMQAQSSFSIESNTPVRWRKYLQTIASDRLVALAAWSDVVAKSKRLRSEGAIDVEVFKPEVITAYVQGDNGRYYTTVQRLGSVPGVGKQGLTNNQVSGWSCECDWGHWAWIRKRSFVGRMCSHAYALFSEMRSLDAKARRNKGKPLSAGRFASTTKVAWTRTPEGFEWVSSDPAMPTAAIVRTASGWNAQVWSDGTADDSLDLGVFQHSKYALRAVGRTINAHLKFADSTDDGDVDLVGGPGSGGGPDDNPYTEDGRPEDETADSSPEPEEGSTRTSSFLSVFAEHDDGQDDHGDEQDDDGVQEEDPEDDNEDEDLDEEVADDENGDNDTDDDSEEDSSDDSKSDDDGDGGHDEPHKRDDDDNEDDGEDPSDDDKIEKKSVAELQRQYGLSHLAGANYSLAEQERLVREGEGKLARNHGDLSLAGTHYEAKAKSGPGDPEDILAFLF